MLDTNRVEHNLNQLQFPSVGEELGFSHKPCWTCDSKLHGDRYVLNYVNNGEFYFEEICTDCALYIVNGEVLE